MTRTYAIVCDDCDACNDVTPTEPIWKPEFCPHCGSDRVSDVSDNIADEMEPLRGNYTDQLDRLRLPLPPKL